jgi:beta-aspartyl-peptidase (threonine type)
VILPLALIAHGGAWNLPDEAVESSRKALRLALEQGWKALRDGASALDVVELTVCILEDDPVFDAGRGSHLNSAGRVEMDASIMEGARLEAGAVAAIRNVRHPVSVARSVMEHSRHVMLVGEGAFEFAENHGAEICRTGDLLVGRERERFLRVRAGESDLVEREFDSGGSSTDGPLGTVGAVALDREGSLAAATSTGGTQDKAPGRVGDTPIIGAGTYADNRVGAASATGLGEGIMRVLLTKTAVDHVEAGMTPGEAGRHAVATLDRVGAKGGIILLDRQGRVDAEFNTPRMVRGWITTDGDFQVAVEPAEGQS